MSPACPEKTESAARRQWRAARRWGVLAAATALAWPWRPEFPTSALLPALSPFLSLCSVLATKTISVLPMLALPVLALAFLSSRWFCRHACPTGFLQELLQRLRPSPPLPSRQTISLGKWLMICTVGGACFGCPVFLWLDPLALFAGCLNSWRQPLALANLVAGLGLPALLLFDLLFPRVWCRRICPLGATQELLAWPRRRFRRRTHGEPPETRVQRTFALGRRGFLGGCAAAAGVLLLRPVKGRNSPPLRPPGAVSEEQFTSLCVRCGNCAQTCPSDIIQPDFGASGVPGLFSPTLRFDHDYCREGCSRCGPVCPSGALANLPLPKKREFIIGLATVDLDTCLLASGRECTACIQRCPYNALVMHSQDGGFSTEPCLDPAKCNGCGACEAVCPVRPRRAIRVVSRASPDM
ncbi:MAG: 4Fe-4S binding protein [Verrucomicrobiia bacterium]